VGMVSEPTPRGLPRPRGYKRYLNTDEQAGTNIMLVCGEIVFGAGLTWIISRTSVGG